MFNFLMLFSLFPKHFAFCGTNVILHIFCFGCSFTSQLFTLWMAVLAVISYHSMAWICS